MANFLFLNSFSWDMKLNIDTRSLANSDWGCNHFSHNYWSSHEYLVHYESNDFCVHQMVIPPHTHTHQLCLLLSQKGYHILSMHSNLLCTHVIFMSFLGITPNCIPLKYIRPINTNNQIRHIFLRRWTCRREHVRVCAKKHSSFNDMAASSKRTLNI